MTMDSLFVKFSCKDSKEVPMLIRPMEGMFCKGVPALEIY